MQVSRVFSFIVREIEEALPAIIFFAVGFSLIELTAQLFLDVYVVRTFNYMLAVGAALVVGKAVLVANALPIFRRFDSSPLILPILFKTAVYWAVVFVFRLLEHLIEYLGQRWQARRRSGISRDALPVVAVHRDTVVDFHFVPDLYHSRGTDRDVRQGQGDESLFQPRRDPAPVFRMICSFVRAARMRPGGV